MGKTTNPAAPVEAKVKAGTAAATVTAAALWALQAYVFGDAVPAPVVGLVELVVTGAVTFVAGYLARHTPRVD